VESRAEVSATDSFRGLQELVRAAQWHERRLRLRTPFQSFRFPSLAWTQVDRDSDARPTGRLCTRFPE